MDIPMIKVRKITTSKLNVYIWVDSDASTMPLPNPNIRTLFNSQQGVSLLVLYLESVCNLSSSQYFIGVSTFSAQGLVCQNCVVLIVDDGIFLPFINTSTFFSQTQLPSSTALPIPQIIGTFASGYILPTTLLFSQSWIPQICSIQPCINTTVIKTGNYYQCYNSLWISTMNNGTFIPQGYYYGYTYQGLGVLNFTTAIQFFQSNFPGFIPYSQSGGFSLYENINPPKPTVISETSQVVSRILSKDFTSFKDFIRENAMLFIKYGVYLFIMYRYAETKIINPINS